MRQLCGILTRSDLNHQRPSRQIPRYVRVAFISGRDSNTSLASPRSRRGPEKLVGWVTRVGELSVTGRPLVIAAEDLTTAGLPMG